MPGTAALLGIICIIFLSRDFGWYFYYDSTVEMITLYGAPICMLASIFIRKKFLLYTAIVLIFYHYGVFLTSPVVLYEVLSEGFLENAWFLFSTIVYWSTFAVTVLMVKQDNYFEGTSPSP